MGRRKKRGRERGHKRKNEEMDERGEKGRDEVGWREKKSRQARTWNVWPAFASGGSCTMKLPGGAGTAD